MKKKKEKKKENRAEVGDVSCHEFLFFLFFRRMIFKTIKNMQNIDFWAQNMFYYKFLFLKFDKSKPFMDKLVKLSQKLKKKRRKKYYGFWLQSHCATLRKNKYKNLSLRSETKISEVWRSEANNGQTRQNFFLQ